MALTPSNITVFQATDALWVEGGGRVDLVLEDGQLVVLLTVPSGSVLPFRAKTLRAATTASNVVALYH